MVFKVEVVNRHVIVSNGDILVVGSVDADTVELKFDSTWASLTKKVYFKNSNDETSYPIAVESDMVTIPSEVLALEGKLYIGFLGTNASTLKMPTVWEFLADVVSGVDVISEEAPAP